MLRRLERASAGATAANTLRQAPPADLPWRYCEALKRQGLLELAVLMALAELHVHDRDDAERLARMLDSHDDDDNDLVPVRARPNEGQVGGALSRAGVLHRAWLSAKSPHEAVSVLAAAVRGAQTSNDDAAKMATAALSGLRKAGDVEGRREYFTALERVGMANGVHYSLMVAAELAQAEDGAQLEAAQTQASGDSGRRQDYERRVGALLGGAATVARLSAEPAAFALLLEHATSLEVLANTWEEMLETGCGKSRAVYLAWHRAAERLGATEQAAAALVELVELDPAARDAAERHATAALRRIGQRGESEMEKEALRFFGRLCVSEEGEGVLANEHHLAAMRCAPPLSPRALVDMSPDPCRSTLQRALLFRGIARAAGDVGGAAAGALRLRALREEVVAADPERISISHGRACSLSPRFLAARAAYQPQLALHEAHPPESLSQMPSQEQGLQ